jgi:hypothetical protein
LFEAITIISAKLRNDTITLAAMIARNVCFERNVSGSRIA